MKTDDFYLRHVADAIADIIVYTQAGKREFFGNKLVQDAVIRKLEIIGEAVKNITDATRGKCPDVPWKQIAGLRDVLIHHYFGVNLDTVWLVVENRLPLLAERVQRLLED